MAEQSAGVVFEVERLEAAGEDRLELTGRWSGVRGLRFVRPSLTVRTDEGERRLLALLDHKPWALEEDGSWVAAFPWDGGPIDPSQAELAVAPHVVVPLGGKPKRGGKDAKSRKAAREQAERERVGRLEREVAWLREEREALVAVREQAREELSAFAAERDEARAEAERVRAELERVQAERERLRAELEATTEARDSALWERDRASEARDSAVRWRDEAMSERDALSGGVERDRERAAREYGAVVAERDRALRERDEARRERDEAMRERDEAVATRKTASAERDAALGRQTGVPTLPAAGAPPQPVRLGALLWGYGSRPASRSWPARALAFGGIVAVLVVLALLLL